MLPSLYEPRGTLGDTQEGGEGHRGRRESEGRKEGVRETERGEGKEGRRNW